VEGLEYREESPDGWAQQAFETWSQETTGSTFRMWGPCPTCGHETEIVVEEFRSAMAGGGTVDLVVVCECGQPHPARPDGKQGCGRGARFDLHLDG
jgi:hypothetical protein